MSWCVCFHLIFGSLAVLVLLFLFCLLYTSIFAYYFCLLCSNCLGKKLLRQMETAARMKQRSQSDFQGIEQELKGHSDIGRCCQLQCFHSKVRSLFGLDGYKNMFSSVRVFWLDMGFFHLQAVQAFTC